MKKKIVLLITLLILIVIALVVLVTILLREKEDVDLIKTTFAFEYGETIHLTGERVLDTEDTSILNSFQADYSSLLLAKGKDYPQLGVQNLQITYDVAGDQKNKTIKIDVKDTKGPEFTKFSDKIEVKKGTDSNSLASYFEAKDMSPFNITVNTENLDMNQSGEYEVEVTATDQFENKSVRKTIITVMEEEKVPPSDPIDSKKPTPYTTSEPRYQNGILIVNKKNPVPFSYTPYEHAEAGKQARSMIKEMQTLGYNISSSYSGFRSFDTQAGLYQRYVNSYGTQQADTFSAKPGYSEHQTGLAFDLLHNNGSLVTNSPEVTWIAEHAARYGFIVRYQEGKETITGYQAEPWHIRYIGPKASDIYQSGLTLEEYLGIQGGGY